MYLYILLFTISDFIKREVFFFCLCRNMVNKNDDDAGDESDGEIIASDDEFWSRKCNLCDKDASQTRDLLLCSGACDKMMHQSCWNKSFPGIFKGIGSVANKEFKKICASKDNWLCSGCGGYVAPPKRKPGRPPTKKQKVSDDE